MINFLIIAILFVAVGGAGLYIYKAKRRGQACIGCPYAKSCGGKGCSCCENENSDIQE